MTSSENVTKQHRLGFIGLGHLGSPMARRLLAAAFPMLVYKRDNSKTNAFAALGADIARDPIEVAGQVNVVLSCVPDGAAVENVYLGRGGVLRNAKPGTMVIEMSTVAPETSQKAVSGCPRTEDFRSRCCRLRQCSCR
jgi:3-hydroxyisobutyrate dehydrogenase-like beta-hydroxyacid dehydrogenase